MSSSTDSPSLSIESNTRDSPTLTFGVPPDQWTYARSTKTYDLARSSNKSSLTLSTSQGAPDTRIRVAPRLSALVIVDMQNFFLDQRCRAHPLGLAAVAPTQRVIEKCREAGIQVVWLNWGLTDHDIETLPASVQRGFSRDLILDGTPLQRTGLGADLGDGQGRCLMAGSWNAEIYGELLPYVQSGDVHCAKNRMSGMWSEEQPLWKYLEKEGKRTLFFTGVNTDQCVLGTLTNAYNAGWDCVMVDDCCATTTEGGKEVCVKNIAGSYGFVVDSKTVCAGTLHK